MDGPVAAAGFAELARAVERVDDPHPFAFEPDRVVLRLLRQHRVVGPGLGEARRGSGRCSRGRRRPCVAPSAAPRAPSRAGPPRARSAAASSWSSIGTGGQLAAGSSCFAARRRTPASTGFTSIRSTSARAGDELVGLAVEQQQDVGAVEPAARLLEAQVDRDGDAAHVADLHVEHDEVGVVLGERAPHVLAAGHLDHVLPAARRTRRAPGRGPTWRRRRRGSWSSGRDRIERAARADLVQRREVVHVVGEEGHVGERGRRPDPVAQIASRCVPLEGRDLAEVGEVVVERAEPRGRRRPSGSARSRSRRGPQARRESRRRTPGARG